ncbi:MAG: M28 family peptidase [Chloroflexi bacterium]|nr:M28 family peptidase [Chloroflexota bacterium]
MSASDTLRGLRPALIESRIRAFTGHGIHRTGWAGDDLTSAWLRDELRALGITAELERFDFPRVEYRTARLSWGDGRADGVPLYDGGFTDAAGIEGDLCAADEEDVFGKIVVDVGTLRGDVAKGGAAADTRYDDLAAAGALGLVLPSSDSDGAIVLRNAERIGRPFRLPVLQVATKDARPLLSTLLVGGEGVLTIDGERLRSRATNVVATLPGTDASARPIGVMTPKSGWFTCAAERGGGIAIWLALAEALAAMPDRRRTVQLVASGGHELSHLGLKDYLKRRPDAAAGPVAWLHLGASIGAREPRARFAAADDALGEIVERALTAAGVRDVEPLPIGQPGNGEAREIHAGGGRFVSFLGGHRFFHSPNDTVDQAVDAESVARWGGAALAIVQGMLDLDG